MLNYAFAKTSRLLTRSEYSQVFNKNTSLVSSYFLILTRYSPLSKGRLGLVIARKRLKKAIMRNTVKRILRESFRLHQHNLCNKDIVVMVRKPLNGINKKLLRKDIDDLWQHLAKKIS